MAKLFIDTNILLDFYRPSEAKLAVFDELTKVKTSLVFTTQSRLEFLRNRTKRLLDATKLFVESKPTAPQAFSIILELPEFKKLQEAIKSAASNVGTISEYLQKAINDPLKDPVYVQFQHLLDDNAVAKLKHSEEDVKKARLRKDLGNPPVTSDKFSIGDELIWELLLRSIPDDLVIVAHDKTFLHNVFLLSEEYSAATNGKNLYVVEKLTDGLKKIGATPSDALLKEEKAASEKPRTGLDFALSGGTSFISSAKDVECYYCHTKYRYNLLQCPICGHPNEIW